MAGLVSFGNPNGWARAMTYAPHPESIDSLIASRLPG